jgi:hypothetical protein
MKNGFTVSVALLIIGIFLGGSALGTLGMDSNGDLPISPVKTLSVSLDFFSVFLEEKDGYITIDMGEEMTYSQKAGYPMIPYRTIVCPFPRGTIIHKVSVDTSSPQVIELSRKIQPSEETIISTLNTTIRNDRGEDPVVYDSSDPYPSAWVTYNLGMGKNGDIPTLFLSLHVYPLCYIPQRNIIQWVDQIQVDIKYQETDDPIPVLDTYDLLVIAPLEFIPDLQPLADHKESHGLKTFIVSLNEIYSGTHFPVQGRDDAEKIKYFIKDALENWGIEYVLIVGGRHGGLLEEQWWVPVRYSHLYDGSGPPVFYEYTYLCDLYFADIYKYENGTPVFDDWDSNQNGVIGEWVRFSAKDILDMYPDIYVGRLPCRNNYEVKTIVEKIITYENTAYGQSWFKRYVAVAGDTYPADNDPFYEGEVATAASFSYLDMHGFNATYLWTSTGAFSSQQDVIDTINQGCGFLHFSGHGNPMGWANHPPHDEASIDGLSVQKMYKLSNTDMYPVCLVGGCHNSQFNVSILNLLKIYEGWEKWQGYIWWGTMSPECWSWWLVRKSTGGTIATIGNSGYGYGIQGENCLTGRGRLMELLFFKSYNEGRDYLGETHGMNLAYYMNEHSPMDDNIDCKVVQQWLLIGDPSLKIGGYPP